MGRVRISCLLVLPQTSSLTLLILGGQQVGGREEKARKRDGERVCLFCFYINKKWVPTIACAHLRMVEKIWGPWTYKWLTWVRCLMAHLNTTQNHSVCYTSLFNEGSWRPPIISQRWGTFKRQTQIVQRWCISSLQIINTHPDNATYSKRPCNSSQNP